MNFIWNIAWRCNLWYLLRFAWFLLFSILHVNVEEELRSVLGLFPTSSFSTCSHINSATSLDTAAVWKRWSIIACLPSEGLWYCAKRWFIVLLVCQLAQLSCHARSEATWSLLLVGVCVTCLKRRQHLLTKVLSFPLSRMSPLMSPLPPSLSSCHIWFFPPPTHPPPSQQPGVPSYLASFTKETCTWKSQRCHHCIECWRVPVPTGPGQHAVSAAGCLHTIG